MVTGTREKALMVRVPLDPGVQGKDLASFKVMADALALSGKGPKEF
jgi:hypothetical protein